MSISKKTYLANSYILFDEYYSHLKSFEIVEQIAEPKTYALKRFISSTFAGHVRSLLKEDYYQKIRREIFSFRLYGNVKHFLDQVNPLFDEASKDIIYTYSFMDHFPRLQRIEPLLNKSRMVNKKTVALIDYYRHKYTTDDPELGDGLEIMKDYMTNFGIRFKDTSEGIWCDVLDS